MIQNKKIQDLFPAGSKAIIQHSSDKKTYYVVTIDFVDLVGLGTTAGIEVMGETSTVVREWEGGCTFFPYSAISSIKPLDGQTFDAMAHYIIQPRHIEVTDYITGVKNG